MRIVHEEKRDKVFGDSGIMIFSNELYYIPARVENAEIAPCIIVFFFYYYYYRRYVLANKTTGNLWWERIMIYIEYIVTLIYSYALYLQYIQLPDLAA